MSTALLVLYYFGFLHNTKYFRSVGFIIVLAEKVEKHRLNIPEKFLNNALVFVKKSRERCGCCRLPPRRTGIQSAEVSVSPVVLHRQLLSDYED